MCPTRVVDNVRVLLEFAKNTFINSKMTAELVSKVFVVVRFESQISVGNYNNIVSDRQKRNKDQLSSRSICFCLPNHKEAGLFLLYRPHSTATYDQSKLYPVKDKWNQILIWCSNLDRELVWEILSSFSSALAVEKMSNLCV